MKLYYEDAWVTIYHGDAHVGLTELSTPIDVVMTDPPYNVRADDITLDGRTMKRDFGEWDEEWSPTVLLTESTRLLRDGGSLLAFTSDRLISVYREWLFLKPRSTLVWEKLNPAPHPRPAYVQATEFIVWLQKPGKKATWNGDGYTPNILRYPVVHGASRFDHPTPKPEAMMMELVARHSNASDVILDPFMGTGTMLAAAKRLGRKAVGIELEERWCAVAARRLSQEALPLFTE